MTERGECPSRVNTMRTPHAGGKAPNGASCHQQVFCAPGARDSTGIGAPSESSLPLLGGCPTEALLAGAEGMCQAPSLEWPTVCPSSSDTVWGLHSIPRCLHNPDRDAEQNPGCLKDLATPGEHPQERHPCHLLWFYHSKSPHLTGT